MKDDYTTNSHYLAHTFLFRNVGRMYFLNLGVKGLICFYCPLLGSAHLIRGGELFIASYRSPHEPRLSREKTSAMNVTDPRKKSIPQTDRVYFHTVSLTRNERNWKRKSQSRRTGANKLNLFMDFSHAPVKYIDCWGCEHRVSARAWAVLQAASCRWSSLA